MKKLKLFLLSIFILTTTACQGEDVMSKSIVVRMVFVVALFIIIASGMTNDVQSAGQKLTVIRNFVDNHITHLELFDPL